MSGNDRGGFARPGFRLLTTGLLLAAGFAAIAMVNQQIEVFGFGDTWPDARSFPRAALWLLTAVLALRLGLSLRSVDTPLGSPARLGRVLAVVASTGGALWLMPDFGFFIGAAGAGIVVTLVLGEKRPLLLILPILIAAIFAYGGRHGLSMPLP